MWYGERDENDPRRGLLSGIGVLSKEQIELSRLQTELNNALHSASQCAAKHDEKSHLIWLERIDLFKQKIFEIESKQADLKNMVLVTAQTASKENTFVSTAVQGKSASSDHLMRSRYKSREDWLKALFIEARDTNPVRAARLIKLINRLRSRPTKDKATLPSDC